jgi:hypothetical protein
MMSEEQAQTSVTSQVPTSITMNLCPHQEAHDSGQVIIHFYQSGHAMIPSSGIMSSQAVGVTVTKAQHNVSRPITQEKSNTLGDRN